MRLGGATTIKSSGCVTRLFEINCLDSIKNPSCDLAWGIFNSYSQLDLSDWDAEHIGNWTITM